MGRLSWGEKVGEWEGKEKKIEKDRDARKEKRDWCGWR